MMQIVRYWLFFQIIGAVCVSAVHAQIPVLPADSLIVAFKKLTRNTPWELKKTIDISFDTFHPQGFARVGDFLFLSSVEVIERTQKYDNHDGRYDRSIGLGKGHLFKMDMQGQLLDRTEIGRDSVYHPGGIDYDGEFVWAPVAEYRPNSSSIVYRVDPVTMAAEEVFSVPDHIGGLIHDIENDQLFGVSWGSRRFYRWNFASKGKVDGNALGPVNNPSHYIDYQDCQYAGRGMAICSGVASYLREGTPLVRMGGIELVDIENGIPIHQIPFPFKTDLGLPMTQNPMWIEYEKGILRLYLMPEDNESRLYIYESNL